MMQTRFWQAIAEEIEKEFKQGHPSTWKKSHKYKIALFIDYLNQKVIHYLNQDPVKARFLAELSGRIGSKIKMDPQQKKFLLKNDESLVSTETMENVFIHCKYNTKETTAHLFAICFGFDRYESYVNQRLLLSEKHRDSSATPAGRVLADWKDDPYYYPGTVIASSEERFYVRFDKGDKHWVEKNKIHVLDIEVGERILCRRGPVAAGYDRWAKIMHISSLDKDGALTVIYEDDEQGREILINMADFCVHR